MLHYADREFRLLTLCAQFGDDEFTAPEITRLLAPAVDWNRFLFLAAKNQVVPLIYSRLCAFGVPQQILETLRCRCVAITSWNLSLASELTALLRLFGEQGIRAIPFKGPTLAIALYGRLDLRQGDDLDIFIKPHDLGRALELMKNSGYQLAAEFAGVCVADLIRQYKDVVLENPVNGICVELHWAICEPAFNHKLRRFSPCTRRSVAVRMLDSLVPIPCPEDALFLLSVHGNRHYWNRLKWICDIAQLRRAYSDLDWEAALETTDSFGSRRTFLLPHVLAKDLMGIPLPAQLVRTARKNPIFPALVHRISTDLSFSDMDTPLWPESRPFFKQFAATDISQKIFRVRSKDLMTERLRLISKLVRDFIRPDAADVIDRPFLSKIKVVYWVIQPLRLIRSCGLAFFLRVSRELLTALVR